MDKLMQYALACCFFGVAFLFGCGISPVIPEGREYPPKHLLPRNRSANSSATRGASSEDLPDLSKEATLQDYLTYAALNNPGLEAAFRQWKAAMERIPQVTSLPNPKLEYGYFIEEVETRVGPQEQKLTLSQVFPWFGKLRLKGEMAAQEAEAAWQKYQAKKLQLFYEVKKAYAEYYFLGKSIAITNDNLELLKYLEEVARESYRAGEAKHSDVVLAQVEMGKLEDRLETLRDLRRPRAAALNVSLGRPADSPLPQPKYLPEEKINLAGKELINGLFENNPDLKALAHRVEKQKKSVALAKKEFYPDFTLGVSYIDTGSSVMSTSDSGKDPFIAMVGLSLPIWRQKYSAAVREARNRVRSAELSLSDKQYSLQNEIKDAVFGVKDARRKIQLYRDTLIPKAEESLKVTQTGFRTGEVDFLDLLDAQRTLLDFQLTVERARANHMKQLARLEKLAGRAFPKTSSNKQSKKQGETKDKNG
jgi:outer membrane protein TolC